MSLKYLFVLDRSLVEAYWRYFHIPIDNIIIERLRQLGHEPPDIGDRWSQLDTYERYLEFQNWFRRTLPGIPMDNEFRLWVRPGRIAGDQGTGAGGAIDGGGADDPDERAP